jgi:hypothetical protein
MGVKHLVAVSPSVWLARTRVAAPVVKDLVGERPPAFALTEDQVALFHREGYLSIPALTTPDEVAWIQAVYDRLFDGRRGWDDGNFFDFVGTDEPGKQLMMPQLWWPSKYQPTLVRTLFRRNATMVARQLLNPSAKMVFDHAVLKPALTGPVTPWHQDQAFWSAGRKVESVTVWMPLQDVDVKSGCMQFVPRSHVQGVLRHRSLNDDPRVHALEAIDPDLSGAVACPLAAGGATVHHYRTLHGSGPNITPNRRRAYAIIFGVRSKEVLVREEYPWNAVKHPAREDRYLASRTPIQRLRDSVKVARPAGSQTTKTPQIR